MFINMLKIFCVILIIAVIQSCLAVLDSSIVTDFFKLKFCNIGTIFGCLTKKEQLPLIKQLQNNGLRVSYFDANNHNINVEMILKRNHNYLSIVVDADCENMESFLEMCATLEYFYDSNYWLVFGSSYNVTKKFKTIKLNINCEITVVTPKNNEYLNEFTNWTVFDIYNPAYTRGGRLRINPLGFYDSEKGFQLRTIRSKYYNRKNMSDTILRSVMVIPENITIPLQEYMSNDDNRRNNTYSRFQSVVIRNCEEMFNFATNFTLLQSWGYLQPNGEVDGMVRALQDKVVDFGSAPLMFKLYRLKVIGYGHGTFIMRSAFFFRHPKTTASSSELYLRPLVNSVWFTTVAILILIALMLRLIISRELRILDSRISFDDVSWSFLILYSVGEICQQGFSYIPSLSSGRIVIITVLLFSFLIYQFYSASVVSILLMEPSRTIITLEDLLKSPLQVGCENSLYDKNYFLRSTNPVALALYNTKIKGPNNVTNFFSAEEGLKKVQEGGFAFHAQTSSAYPLIWETFPEKAVCDLAEIQMYRTQHLYTTMTKRSPFKEMLNYCVVHQTEVGVMDRLRKHWLVPTFQCLQPTEHLEISVGLKESYWVLVLLVLGIIISLIILIVECVWPKEKILLTKKRKHSVKPFVS